MPSRYKLSSHPGSMGIEQLSLPERLTISLRESGIASIDQLYALMIGTPDLVKRMFVDFHVDFDEQLREARNRLPTDVIAELHAMNTRKAGHSMGVIPQSWPNGPLRVIRRS